MADGGPGDVARRVMEARRHAPRDPFAVLGGPKNLHEARAARNRLALRLHPDKQRACTAATRRLCEEALKVVNVAFGMIADESGGADDPARHAEDDRRAEAARRKPAPARQPAPAAASAADVNAARAAWGAQRCDWGGPGGSDSGATPPPAASFDAAAPRRATSPPPATTRRWAEAPVGPASAASVDAARAAWGTTRRAGATPQPFARPPRPPSDITNLRTSPSPSPSSPWDAGAVDGILDPSPRDVGEGCLEALRGEFVRAETARAHKAAAAHIRDAKRKHAQAHGPKRARAINGNTKGKKRGVGGAGAASKRPSSPKAPHKRTKRLQCP